LNTFRNAIEITLICINDIEKIKLLKISLYVLSNPKLKNIYDNSINGPQALEDDNFVSVDHQETTNIDNESDILSKQLEDGLKTLDVKKFIMSSLLTGKTSEGTKSFFVGKNDNIRVRFVIYIEPK
jgi:hypothetical protein